MKHTPGPWEVEGSNIVYKLPNQHWHPTVAMVSDPNDAAHHTETTVANAKLIAASPTMYKELKRIAGVPLLGEDGYCGLDRSDALGFIRIARAAIAKATE